MYTDIILTISTVILAISTVVLAIYTYRLWSEAEKTREYNIELNKPELSVIFEPSKKNIIRIDINIKNIGKSPIYNLKLIKVENDFSISRYLNEKIKISESLKYLNKINYLRPSQEIEQHFTSIRQIKIKSEYLFSWDNIPGNDNGRLIEFLTQKFGVDWIKIAKIEKIDDDKTIRLIGENDFLSLKLNNEKTNVILEINDNRTYEFIANIENGKLNIYKSEYVKFSLFFEYMDNKGEGYEKRFDFDFGFLDMYHQTGNEPIYEISESLKSIERILNDPLSEKKIEKILGHLSSEFGEINIITQTKKEKQDEDKKLIENVIKNENVKK